MLCIFFLSFSSNITLVEIIQSTLFLSFVYSSAVAELVHLHCILSASTQTLDKLSESRRWRPGFQDNADSNGNFK